MFYLAILAAVFLCGLFFFQILHFVQGYRKATGTPWQRVLAVFSNSLTILWARVVAFAGAAMTFVTTALPTLDPSSTTGATFAALFNADTLKYWLASLSVLGLLFEFARRRSGSVDPILPPPQATK